MNNLSEEKIELILAGFENQDYDIEELLTEIRQEYQSLYQFALSEDNNFLTDVEREQLIFALVLFWKLQDAEIQNFAELAAIEELEEELWPMSEVQEEAVITSMSRSFPLVPPICIELINDIADPDLDPTMTDNGCDWIFVKALTFAVLIFGE